MNSFRSVFKQIIETYNNNIWLSRHLGKSDAYISALLSRGNIPSAVLFCKISNLCGYDVIVRNRVTGEETIIDPKD